MCEKLYYPLANGDSKPFYRYVKEIKGNNNSISSIQISEKTSSNDLSDIANTLNLYFHSVFTPACVLPEAPAPTDADNILVTSEGVLKLIKSLKNGKASGPDSISKQKLLLSPEIISSLLASIYNYTLTTGTLPSEWKLAHVTPIFKQGNRELPSNYRPISLTSIVCKMMEHIILHLMQNKLNEILSINQHGFRSHLSCTTQLACLTHDILSNMDNGMATHAAVLDFSKAFDLVPHHLLIQKLIEYKVNPLLVKWISSFLTSRFQRVVIKGHKSDAVAVTSGVPQGSVLGPALFTLFINDITKCVKYCTVRLFADDTILYTHISKDEDKENLQNDLNALHNWSIKNSMKFNATKSNIIVFDKSPKPITHTYYLSNEQLVQSSCVKYLGIYLVHDLKWDYHINSVVNKAMRILGLIKNVLYDAPVKVKLIAYTTLCRPLLEYACEIWDPAHLMLSNNLEKVQNKAVRFVKNLKGWDVSVTESKAELNLKALNKSRQEHRFTLFFKVLQHEAFFPNLINTLNSMKSLRNTNIGDSNSFNSISCNTNKFLHSFLIRTARELRTGETLAD